ncbi:threonine/serine dehydratase [Marininema halotolerans]|uniref:threonine ammonia-lyase n=1 Tax=Marininema halotolerans TaxID=1155944 RepID=A0A1I6TMR6_9BACL|nr:threonine/serine dehydratase [Marininema halotolerans]SFS90543.1 threonine dehydratase [Marininema halotolerans]
MACEPLLHNLSYMDVLDAWSTLRGAIHRTPVFTSSSLDSRTEQSAYLKCEHLQHTGSFKFRGAYHLLSQLSPRERSKGVLTFSSGNLAQAIALAAHLNNTHATICVPRDTSRVKLEATRKYGAEILFYDRHKEDRTFFAQQAAAERGSYLFANDHPAIIAGAGTAVLELLEDVPDLDSIVVPVSSGGLAAGACLAIQGHKPSVRIYGVEPEGAGDTLLSLERKERTRIPPPKTIADGLRSDIPGVHSFPVNLQYLKGILLVSDEDILAAIRYAARHLNILLEPSGAATLAALLQGKVPGKRIGVLLSGGNIQTQFIETLWNSDRTPISPHRTSEKRI